ncbi:hypothetical protein UFOVP1204_72 [uncultured Caudovirales phage]|uniref:Uncharacterized protein n=1 Tax=uncultured Caudovirales phage TaxID=2100421 RepID=A0A6J5R7T6_9CAUD|nr:hypothetical protein UFOVP473_29 [uncultured Caudovirales phage]CAB4176483.1 hypothetical protein UFOVP983_29 [uncultured Caudovirales phage]CAB4190457.1 hypothetical protein UFOVP1204_72 [uncultured Caudovirales phage]
MSELVDDLRLNASFHLLVVEDYISAADRIEELEAALKPFAAIMPSSDKSDVDLEHILIPCSAGDVRRAQAILGVAE